MIICIYNNNLQTSSQLTIILTQNSTTIFFKDEFTGDMEVGFFSMIDTTAARLGEESI